MHGVLPLLSECKALSTDTRAMGYNSHQEEVGHAKQILQTLADLVARSSFEKRYLYVTLQLGQDNPTVASLSLKEGYGGAWLEFHFIPYFQNVQLFGTHGPNDENTLDLFMPVRDQTMKTDVEAAVAFAIDWMGK
jgi:hypothetical protein